MIAPTDGTSLLHENDFNVFIAFLIVIILEPNTPTLLDLKWQTIVIIAIYFILSLKILVKLSRSLSNSICNFLFGKEEENDI